MYSIKKSMDSPVWNVHATINSSFQGTKYLCSSAGPGQTHIQESSEGTWGIINTFDIVLLARHLIYSIVNLMQIQFSQHLITRKNNNFLVKLHMKYFIKQCNFLKRFCHSVFHNVVFLTTNEKMHLTVLQTSAIFHTWTHIFQGIKCNCINCIHNCEDHSLQNKFSILNWWCNDTNRTKKCRINSPWISYHFFHIMTKL